MNMKRLAIAVTLLVVLGVQAFADDLYPPPWRTNPPGQGSTTYQAWEFSTDTNPTPPDVNLNHFGTPVADVHGAFPNTVWLNNDHGHQGVWRFDDYIQLDVPNDPVPHPFKEIWLQVTFSSDLGNDLLLLTNPPYTGAVELVNKVQLDDYYWHSTFRLRIEPNPASETIYIQPRNCTAYVDEIVLDTISAPEPASLLLVLAGVVLRRKR